MPYDHVLENMSQIVLIVPIKRILMRRQMAESIKKYDGLVKEFKRDPSTRQTLPLNRLGNMGNLFMDGVQLPPIRVQMIISNDKKYYSIIDGRHRFVLSVLFGYVNIPICL